MKDAFTISKEHAIMTVFIHQSGLASVFKKWLKNQEMPPVDDLGLSPAISRALYCEGIRTIAELAIKTDRDLLRIPGLGRKSIATIRKKLAKYKGDES
jgi:DNA-directed RNA polymerase alpha subunit